MTLKELRDWADKLISDQEYRHFENFEVIFNPLKFGDRQLQGDTAPEKGESMSEVIKIRDYATKKTGGSVQVTIPQLLLRAAQIDPGDRVTIYLDVIKKRLIIEKAKTKK